MLKLGSIVLSHSVGDSNSRGFLMSWTDERTGLLKKLWADGFSASQIAGELGGFGDCADGGRSAVCGKISRLGLSGRKKSPSSSASRPHGGAPATPKFYKKHAAGLSRSLSDVAVDPNAPETVAGSRISRFGKPPHLSSRDKHLMGLDKDESPAFEGIPREVVEAFSPYYK